MSTKFSLSDLVPAGFIAERITHIDDETCIVLSRAGGTASCPGCGRMIEPGTAHLVAWRADGVLGDAADLAARRHWHTHCWRIA